MVQIICTQELLGNAEPAQTAAFLVLLRSKACHFPPASIFHMLSSHVDIEKDLLWDPQGLCISCAAPSTMCRLSSWPVHQAS